MVSQTLHILSRSDRNLPFVTLASLRYRLCKSRQVYRLAVYCSAYYVHAIMPPSLSNFKSRTTSLLDNITGVIPESPPNSTFKDKSLTCRRCGNRFRDRLELSSHFNLLPHHSDYSDSFDFDSFTRPKGRRSKTLDQHADLGKAAARDLVVSPSFTTFSESQAYYNTIDKDKHNQSESRPAFLRKFPTFTNLTTIASDDQLRSPPATDYANQDAVQSPTSSKAKGKQRATPRLPQDGSFQYGQPLASSDEESDPPALGMSSKSAVSPHRLRARSATIQTLTSESESNALARTSLSSIASRSGSSGINRQAPPLPPKLPAFDWQPKDEKLVPKFSDNVDEVCSVASDSSFRTAGSAGRVSSEKAQLEALYSQEKLSSKNSDKGAFASSVQGSFAIPGVGHGVLRSERDQLRTPARHCSESNLLLESMDASHDDAPPSYYELHGDTDPFNDLPTSALDRSPHTASRSEGFATMPGTPVSRVGSHQPRRSRGATNANTWSSFASEARFPVTFSSFDGPDQRNDEEDLYNPPSEESSRRPVKSKSIDLPALVSSSSFSSSPSPSTPKTPVVFFDDAPLAAQPLTWPRPAKPSSSVRRRSRHNSRAKSDAAAPSTRCPTCFVKFSSLDKTLQHLDNSECGAVEFESGIN